MEQAEGKACGFFAPRAEPIASSPSFSEESECVKGASGKPDRLSWTEPQEGLGLAASILALIVELLAGGTRARGPPLCGVVITARRAGALLTGLATALAVGSRRSGVVITAPKAGAIFPPPLRFGVSLRGETPCGGLA